MTEERWRDVKRYEGIYKVSSIGQVKRIWKTKQCILKPGKGIYLNVSLCRDGQSKTRQIHHLVLEAFVGQRPDGFIANHKDGNKWNNNISNLEWCTYAQNNRHAMENGLWNPAQNHSSSKPVHQYDLGGNLLRRYKSCIEAERQTGIDNSNICAVLNEKRKTAGGYKWMKAE